jgi:hypothetical protein
MKQPPGDKWRRTAANTFFQSEKAPYVVNRIEYTDNHVESAIDSKVDHILPEEF